MRSPQRRATVGILIQLLVGVTASPGYGQADSGSRVRVTTAAIGGGTGLLLGLIASTRKTVSGAGLGALIGAVSHREEWEEVPLPVASPRSPE
jgi:hypothetical protein